ncbi:MAG: ArsR family transcriptional regulator [Holophagae bacterium]|nr:MAG: ArsR family transcriptional regulator [Holophagae bacterium]
MLRAGEVAAALGVTRQTAHRYLRQLVAEGHLVAEGAGRGARYRRSDVVDVRRFRTAGLDEDRVWVDMSGPVSTIASLGSGAQAVLHYALTELVNNAVEHSSAPEVEVTISRSGEAIELAVRDEGVGVFEHLRQRLGLASELEALQELSKGKTTTMPERHSGEGLFFTSKAANRFELASGSLRWVVDNRRDDTAVGSVEPPVRGTTVRVEVDPDRARDLTEVFAEYTRDFEFTRTRMVIRLFAIGTTFMSRSQAKRLVNGLERFREVVLDFGGVELVGQGFVDEVFRVWAKQHPEVALIPIAMCAPVAFMVERAIRGASAFGRDLQG